MSGSKGEKDADGPDGPPSADGDYDMEPSVVGVSTGKRFLDVKGKLSMAQGKCVSEDRDAFQSIMDVFSEYEIKMRAGGLRSNMTEAFKILSAKKSLDTLFPRDFPFYLILANRIHCLADVYRHDTFGKFVAACSERFQDLSNSELQETLVAGFLKREDFEITECAEKTSVFKLLEDACLGFAKRSPFSERKKLKTPVYSAMLWISVALKCHCARGAVTRGASTMWQLHFLEKCQHLKLTPELIEELEKGTSLGLLLQLPSELAFHPEWLGDSFLSKDNVQLLSHLREFVKAMDVHISLEVEFCNNFLKIMRSAYSWYLEDPTPQSLRRVCRDGTLLCAVREGLAYLDLVRDVIMKKWELNQELQEHFQKWLSILVRLVDITSEDAEECLTELLKSELQIVKMFSGHIQSELVEATRSKLPSLPVDRLFHLYSTFDIWETSHMDHYFQNYKVVSSVDLTDVLWGELLRTIQSRSKPGECLGFILKLFKEVAESYFRRGKASDFVISLLKLNTPWLFSELPQQPLPAFKATATPNTRSGFAAFLTGYIRRHSLNHVLLKDIDIVWECCSDDRNDFQELVLSCIAKEIIADITVIKGTMEESLQRIVSRSLSVICGQSQLLEPKSATQIFCWALVGACCQRIPTDRGDVAWISDYSIVMCQLGQIYQTFSRTKSDSYHADTILSELASSEIPDVAAYFSFVLEIRQILMIWNDKFTTSKINNYEIGTYRKHWKAISELGESLGANSLVVTSGDVGSRGEHFLEVFEKLNSTLIKYTPGEESKRIDVITLLSRYGVSFPNNLQSAITQFVAFPSEDKYQSDDFEALPVSIAGLDEGFVKLSKCIQLKQLDSLVLSIERFTEPLCNHMDMLVYFTIHESKMFQSYLKDYLTSEDSKQEFLSSYKENSFEFQVFAPAAKSELDDTPTQELIFLQQALRKTKLLLQQIGDGSATYGEVTVNNTLDLNIVVLDHELQTISSYLERQIQPVYKSHTHVHAFLGADYIRCMLVLLELRKHIPAVVDVSKKFELSQCLDDPSLGQLVNMAESLDSELKRSVLTLSDASQKMEVAKECLCLQNMTDFTFLTLFTVLADSVPFYKFLCDGNFTGMEGRERFNDKCQLITTQLQHVDYNEVVLNHLIAAYEYIFPFTNKGQTLQTLMTSVSTLDVSKGCKQLKTVNHNIDLIKIWFSAQPGDTVRSILHDLDSIFETGHYQFVLTSTSLGSICHLQLVYQRTPTPLPVTSRMMRVEKREGSEASQALTHRRVPTGMIRAPSPTHKSVPAVWDNMEITDFVHKLGFLDAKKTAKDRIEHFHKIYQVAQRLAELYLRLQKIGHENYQQKMVTEHLTCFTTEEEAEKIEELTRQELSKCREIISAQHRQYEWLIFFSTAKVLKLYQQLVADPPDVDGLVDEVALLLLNEPAAKQAIKERLQGKEFLDETEKAPMPIVGKFLTSLLSDDLEAYSVKSYCKKSHCKDRCSQPQCCWGLSMDKCSVVLHHSPWQTAFSQKHLVMLVISLYDGAPETFQVFQCKPSTTVEEIHFFFQKVVKYPQSYLVLGIDSLAVHLQEVFLQLFLDHRKELEDASVCLHLVENAPSVLREIPWILKQEHKDLKIGKEEVTMKLRKKVLHPRNIACVELLYGPAGAGKSHQIQLELRNKGLHSVTIAVNEAFTLESAISRLCSLPKQEGCAVVFNFTMIPPHESMDEPQHCLYNQQMETVRWFFFSLLILGYVEDPVTGLSFQFPCGLSWIIFVEVPSLDVEHAEGNLLRFKEQIPVLGLLGVPHYIHPVNPFTIDDDVRHVCGYLKAFEEKTTELTVNIEDHECTRLLKEYIPKTVQGVTAELHVKENKTAHRLFLKYLKRRCEILNSVPKSGRGKCRFIWKRSKKNEENIYSEEEEKWLPVFEVMLQEVCEICQWSVEQEGEDGRKRWTPKLIKQLIYGERKGVPTFELLDVDQDEYMKELAIRTSESTLLHSYLSHALGVPLTRGRLLPVDQSQYLLTLDNTIKMLHIHERFQCGVPVIIEGETGVGKTTLIEVLSKLWNHALLAQWEDRRKSLVYLLKRKLGGSDVELILSSDEKIMKQQLLQFMEAMVVTDQNEVKEFLKEDPLFFLFCGNPIEYQEDALEMLGCNKNVAELLCDFLKGKFHSMFHKLSVHSGLRPVDILQFFQPILSLARKLSDLRVQLPHVTVFLDEVNTSSCLGLLKEIIVDQTINGEAIPPNVFIIAACNPHRANSLSILDDQTSIATASKETWVRGSYYVQKLPPTLRSLIWDYKALDDEQEREYIRAKLWQLNKADVAKISREKLDKLTHLIAISHNLMRDYAKEHFAHDCHLDDLDEDEAVIRSQSFVSQRDIQRVFTFYEWLMRVYSKLKPHGDHDDYSHRAVLVALGIVYYLRLNGTYRKEYRGFLDSIHKTTRDELIFSKAFETELDWYTNLADIPSGVAKTQALKENLFAIIVCTMTRTPLIIIGPPGSSKTLSFRLALANLKGEGSRIIQFRTEVFHSLDPHIYQCSRRTTPTELETVFDRAIKRQNTVGLPIYCVVFMDEVGLPEEKYESLKVLHKYLDTSVVSFVGITNRPLDAAKSNRAVTLYRLEPSNEDLLTLAKGCFAPSSDNLPPELLTTSLQKVNRFCPAYSRILRMELYHNFFGLRDFIHFIRYLRRNRAHGLTPQVIMQALERNFGGTAEFENLCQIFLSEVDSSLDSVHRKNILDVLKESLEDRPSQYSIENEVRYKMIIDLSEDSSLVRLLFSFGVLKRGPMTKMLCCSSFLGNTTADKVNAIAAVLHSVSEGHTVLMYQTDEIHESFYNLFNQNFHCIDDPDKAPWYFTNVAIGPYTKPCLVHQNFQCVIVVKQSELLSMPPPFLNRFEKYLISHKLLLESRLMSLPTLIRAIFQTAHEKVDIFLKCVRSASSVYGLQKETLDSLVLSMLPTWDHKYEQMSQCELCSQGCNDTRVTLLDTLITAFAKNAGFHFYPCSPAELEEDARSVFDLVLSDTKFAGFFQQLSEDMIEKNTVEALNALCNTSSAQVAVSTGAALVISVLHQWVIRYLCKSLIQLMTPEALALHQEIIPLSYRRTYLLHQHHFSLRDLITSFHEHLKDGKVGTPTKLLCYTRSSGLVHKIPGVYPRHSLSMFQPDSDDIVQRLVLRSAESVHIFKLLNLHSYKDVNNALRRFIDSDAEIMLIVINMKEMPTRVVNELRIMIEEAENERSSYNKLFVLLLHFPPSMFIDACYPALFLQGWIHYYLDTVMIDTDEGNVDIRKWFQNCCADIHVPQDKSGGDTLSLFLPRILKEFIPILPMRLRFGSLDRSPFNRQMLQPERMKLLQSLLQVGSAVGEVLVTLFKDYWNQTTMAKYLQKAARFTRNGESTLNMTDCLQEILKTLFLDFLLYMVSKMNENFNLDVWFGSASLAESASIVESASVVKPASLDTVCHLFVELVKALPVPHISELKMAYSALREQGMESVHTYAPTFPFFAVISKLIEKGLDESQEEINQQLNVLDESNASVRNDEKVKQLLVNTVLLKLQNMKDEHLNCLKIAMKAISTSDALWDRYFLDFTHTKLHMEYVEDSISNPLLKAAFGGHVDGGQGVEHRIVVLHVHFHVHQLEIAKLAILLRSLDRIKQMASTVPQPLKKTVENKYIEAAKQSKLIAGEGKHLAVFVIDTLFNTLEVACAADESSNLLQWYHTYSGVMLLPFVKKFIYSYISRESRLIEVEAKINIMHATYAVAHSLGLEDLTTAQVVFMKLYSEHFSKESMKMTTCPNLCDIATWTLALVSGSTSLENLQYSEQVAVLMELHFSHFFSKERCDWTSEDISWFLRLANEQSHWKACYVEAQTLSTITKPGPTDAMRKECIPVTVFQFFLSRLLLLHTRPSPAAHSLCENNCKALDLLRQVLASCQEGNQGRHIPISQPLAHLYFLVVLEQHLNRTYDILKLLQIADHLEQQSCNLENDTGRRILASIERQALLQVILKTVAEHLDIRKPDQLATLANHSQAVQKVVSEAENHRLILALYMLKQLQSFQMFTTIVTTMDLCNEFQFLGYFHHKFEKRQEHTKVQLPLVGSGANDELDGLYKRVCKAMKRAHSQKKFDHLQKLAQECKREQKQLNFDMMVWLCAYYEFFNMKKSSPDLAIRIPTVVDLEEQPLAMLQCLLNSKLIKPENRDAESILQVLDDNSLIEVRHTLITLVAVILGSPPRISYLWYLLFQPEKLLGSYIPGFLLERTVDPDGGDFYDTGVELTSSCVYSRDDYARYAMKGAVSLHSLYTLLWANLGVMSMAVLFLPRAGEVLRRKFISPQSTQKSYFVSHLMKLWRSIPQNLGISEEDCSFLLRTCFKKFREFSCEYMAGECFHGIYKLQEECETFEAHWHKSIFQPAWVEMQQHTQELVPDWAETMLCSAVKKINNVFEHFGFVYFKHNGSYHQQVCKNEVFLEIRHFDSCNPHFPSTGEFVQNVLSKADLSKFHLLAHIILQQPLLQAGRLLLPVLIEFYQWLHSDLAYLVTEEYAHEMTVGKVVTEASKHYYSSAGRKDLSALYKQLKESFAEYVQLMGEVDGDGDQSTCAVVEKSSMIFAITDETRLLQLLSTSADHGSLYGMIESIIKCHNTTLDILEEITCMPRYSHMKKYTTEPYTSLIHPTEFKQHTSIMGTFAITTGHDEFEQLVRMRYQHYTASTTVLTEFCGSASILEVPKVPKFDLHQMQEDIAVELVAGKPRITDASNLRKNFYFKRIRSSTVDQDIDQETISLTVSDFGKKQRLKCSYLNEALEDLPSNLAQELASLEDRLPAELKYPLGQMDLDGLEVYFHSFNYHSLQEVAAGLCTATELLIRKLSQDKEALKKLCSCNLRDLLATENTEIFDAKNTEDPLNILMEKIGIQSLSLSRMRQLSVIHLPYLFASLQMFANWIKVGQYDYCSLPHRLKVHLMPTDEIALMKISDTYDGSIPDLIGELNTLAITLTHCETHFVQLTVKDIEEPIKHYLKEHHCTSEYEKLPKQIPNGIRIKHYVQFRIQLRRLMDQVQKQVSTPELVSAMWDEVAPPIVGSHLQAISEEEEQIAEQYPKQPQEEAVEADQRPVTTAVICPEVLSEQKSLDKESQKEATDEKSHELEGKELAAHIEKQSSKYTNPDVADFLTDIGLEQYAASFNDMEITGDRLIDPDDLKDILEELGVTNPVHQLKILAGFKRKLMCDIGVPSPTDPGKMRGKDPLSEFLKRFKMPPSYIENFVSGDIDWELLLYVTDDPLKDVLQDVLSRALEQIGITKGLHKHLFKKNFRRYICDNFM